MSRFKINELDIIYRVMAKLVRQLFYNVENPGLSLEKYFKVLWDLLIIPQKYVFYCIKKYSLSVGQLDSSHQRSSQILSQNQVPSRF